MSANTVAFVRVSTNDQSVEGQRMACRNYARQHGMVVAAIHVLRGSSYQPSYEKTLVSIFNGLLQRPGITHLVFNSADRLARNVMAFCNLVHRIRNRDITMHFITENLLVPVRDFQQPTVSACTLFNFINQGQTTSAVLSAKVKRGLANLKALHPNAFTGGSVPFGKSLDTVRIMDRDIKILVDTPGVSELAKYAQYAKRKGWTNSRIATVLNGNGMYMPTWFNQRVQMFLMTDDMIEKLLKIESSHVSARRLQDFLASETDEMYESFNVDQVMDTAVYRRKGYTQVVFEGEETPCWIPSDMMDGDSSDEPEPEESDDDMDVEDL